MPANENRASVGAGVFVQLGSLKNLRKRPKFDWQYYLGGSVSVGGGHEAVGLDGEDELVIVQVEVRVGAAGVGAALVATGPVLLALRLAGLAPASAAHSTALYSVVNYGPHLWKLLERWSGKSGPDSTTRSDCVMSCTCPVKTMFANPSTFNCLLQV